MKKLATFVFAASLFGSYSMFASAASTCQINCFTKFDACLDSLPYYKCEQIYKTCLRNCGG